MVEPAIPSTPAALAGAGLYLNADPSGGDRKVYVVTGRTYDHKEALKAHGGRWSKSRSAWVFDDPAMIERLSTAFGEAGASEKPGFAEAPRPFQLSSEAALPSRPCSDVNKAEIKKTIMAIETACVLAS